MEHVKKVYEGMWSDIVRRGSTGELRKEDDYKRMHPAKEVTGQELYLMMRDGIVHLLYRKMPTKKQRAAGEPGTLRDAWATKSKEFYSFPTKPIPSHLMKSTHGRDCDTYVDMVKSYEKDDCEWRIYGGGGIVGVEDYIFNEDQFKNLIINEEAETIEDLINEETLTERARLLATDLGIPEDERIEW